MVCWSTWTEDRAAWCFLSGFYHALGRALLEDPDALGLNSHTQRRQRTRSQPEQDAGHGGGGGGGGGGGAGGAAADDTTWVEDAFRAGKALLRTHDIKVGRGA